MFIAECDGLVPTEAALYTAVVDPLQWTRLETEEFVNSLLREFPSYRFIVLDSPVAMRFAAGYCTCMPLAIYIVRRQRSVKTVRYTRGIAVRVSVRGREMVRVRSMLTIAACKAQKALASTIPPSSALARANALRVVKAPDRITLTAWLGAKLLGHLTLAKSCVTPFDVGDLREIADVYVLRRLRAKAVNSTLLAAAHALCGGSHLLGHISCEATDRDLRLLRTLSDNGWQQLFTRHVIGRTGTQ